MTEQNTQGLEQFLTQEVKKEQDTQLRQEQIRQVLESNALAVKESYEHECAELLPFAQERVAQVVQPWFDNLIAKGIWKNLLSVLQEDLGSHTVSASDSVLYYWPNSKLRDLQEDNTIWKPFELVANRLAGKNNAEYIQRLKQEQEINAGDVWRASFHIGGNGRHNGLYIARWPGSGGSYAFAVGSARKLEIPVRAEEISQAVPSIHPEVWLGFADQVESGKALEVLEQSLQPREFKVLNPDEKAQRDSRNREQVVAYLQHRRERGR